MEEKKKWDLVSIASIPLVITLGNSMLIPVLPVIEQRLHITSFQSSLVIAGPPLFAVLMKISPKAQFLAVAVIGVVAVLFALFAMKPGADTKLKDMAPNPGQS